MFQSLKGSLTTMFAVPDGNDAFWFQSLKGSLTTRPYAARYWSSILLFQSLKGSLTTQNNTSYQIQVTVSFNPLKAV